MTTHPLQPDYGQDEATACIKFADYPDVFS